MKKKIRLNKMVVFLILSLLIFLGATILSNYLSKKKLTVNLKADTNQKLFKISCSILGNQIEYSNVFMWSDLNGSIFNTAKYYKDEDGKFEITDITQYCKDEASHISLLYPSISPEKTSVESLKSCPTSGSIYTLEQCQEKTQSLCSPCIALDNVGRYKINYEPVLSECFQNNPNKPIYFNLQKCQEATNTSCAPCYNEVGRIAYEESFQNLLSCNSSDTYPRFEECEKNTNSLCSPCIKLNSISGLQFEDIKYQPLIKKCIGIDFYYNEEKCKKETNSLCHECLNDLGNFVYEKTNSF